MTKTYLPDDPIDGGQLLSRGYKRFRKYDNHINRCINRCFMECILTTFTMFLVFGGGTFIGFNVNRMPGDHAGYVVNDDGAISIYYPDSIYFISPYVTLKLVDISDHNLTIRDRQCLVTITNVRRFLTAVHHNNDSIENLKRNISLGTTDITVVNVYGINVTQCHVKHNTFVKSSFTTPLSSTTHLSRNREIMDPSIVDTTMDNTVLSTTLSTTQHTTLTRAQSATPFPTPQYINPSNDMSNDTFNESFNDTSPNSSTEQSTYGSSTYLSTHHATHLSRTARGTAISTKTQHDKTPFTTPQSTTPFIINSVAQSTIQSLISLNTKSNTSSNLIPNTSSITVSIPEPSEELHHNTTDMTETMITTHNDFIEMKHHATIQTPDTDHHTNIPIDDTVVAITAEQITTPSISSPSSTSISKPVSTTQSVMPSPVMTRQNITEITSSLLVHTSSVSTTASVPSTITNRRRNRVSQTSRTNRRHGHRLLSTSFVVPENNAGYSYTSNGPAKIYRAGSTYSITDHVRLIDISTRNHTIGNQLCTVSIVNVDGFLYFVNAYNNDVERTFTNMIRFNRTDIVEIEKCYHENHLISTDVDVDDDDDDDGNESDSNDSSEYTTTSYVEPTTSEYWLAQKLADHMHRLGNNGKIRSDQGGGDREDDLL